MKRSLSPVQDDCVLLRLLEPADLPLTLRWRNQDHIRRWFVHSEVIQPEQHEAWFQHYAQLDNDFMFVIVAKDLGNLPVGQISLYDIDWAACSAEYGRLMIGEAVAKGRGYAKRATRLVLQIGFAQLGLEEIHLEVKADNENAIAVYEAAGFTRTGAQDGLVLMSIGKFALYEGGLD